MSEEYVQPVKRPAADRLKAVFRIEPGVFKEIAEDNMATGQACGVFAVAVLLGNVWVLPLVMIALPAGFVLLALLAGLFRLVAGFFVPDAPQSAGATEAAGGLPPYVGWLRAVLFASAPAAFGIIPLIGTLVGGIFTLILQVSAIRELSRMPVGAAVMTWIIAMLLPGILLIAAIMVFGLSALGIFGLSEVFG